ncbi:hypothetical protein GCM10009677_23700 [Sphaerisporangium rubeum]|uniref:Uncharacterized protein n=1 Tax=Sphaerisporangium rubeum TaxID=321317 RepID=A0A7X0M5P7_9ACTN|nr:hypothetical protein [Sphaerisporangium rubeum]MBB6472595.1 hypothetical protein [Sphaerisporangium rubeum]
MTTTEDIGDRRARAQTEALAGLREALAGPALRCVIVERVRLVLPRKFGPRVHLPPYMEIHGRVGLLATVSVIARRTGRFAFSISRPTATQPTEVKDAESLAAHILADMTSDESPLPGPAR